MSLLSSDFSPAKLDAFDERHEADRRARAVCQELIVDDDSSAVPCEALLEAALRLIIGSLLGRRSPTKVAAMLCRLAKQITRDGVMLDRGHTISLD